jgi:hypothetical protein
MPKTRISFDRTSAAKLSVKAITPNLDAHSGTHTVFVVSLRRYANFISIAVMGPARPIFLFIAEKKTDHKGRNPSCPDHRSCS